MYHELLASKGRVEELTEEVATLAVYLASDASRFHTGDVLRIDGFYMIF